MQGNEEETADYAECAVCGRVEEKKHMIEIDGMYYCRPCMGDED